MQTANSLFQADTVTEKNDRSNAQTSYQQSYADLFTYLLLGLGAFLFLVLFVGQLPITDPVESNYALTAREMLAQGSYISPVIYGHAWYDKPVLTYWMLMVSYKLFGFTDFASRLPAIITASLTIPFLALMVKKITGQLRLARWSGITLLTSLQFWYTSHAIITDGYLFLFSIGIFGCAYLALRDRKASYMNGAYAFAALAVLTKGPVGVVLPGIILLAYVLLAKRHETDGKNWRILFSPAGIGIFLLIALPWYIAMYSLHGSSFINGFLGLHNITRATVSEHPRDNVWYYYLLLEPLALLPWTGASFMSSVTASGTTCAGSA